MRDGSKFSNDVTHEESQVYLEEDLGPFFKFKEGFKGAAAPVIALAGIVVIGCIGYLFYQSFKTK